METFVKREKMLLLLFVVAVLANDFVITVVSPLTSHQKSVLRAQDTVEEVISEGEVTILLVKSSYQEPVDYLTALEAEWSIDVERVLEMESDWGPDRVDQVNLPLDGVFNAIGTGAGVNIYIVDTGVGAHSEFGSRLQNVFQVSGSGGYVCGSHGTAVASAAAGSTVGVARKANIKNVKVTAATGSSCPITLSQLIQALVWLNSNAVSPAVINLSLSGAGSSTTDSQINSLISKGHVVVAAAGNYATKNGACALSPARNPNVITVAASNIADERWSSSNYGSCIQLFAPGASVKVAIPSGGFANSASGTSFASPYVAGGAAIAFQKLNNPSVSQVRSWVITRTVVGAISNPSGTPNKLLYVGTGPGGQTAIASASSLWRIAVLYSVLS